MRKFKRSFLILLGVLFFSLFAIGSLTALASVVMPGDENGDGQTTIDEVQKCINQFLGISYVQPHSDINGDDQVTIDELQKSVNAFLGLTGPVEVPGNALGNLYAREVGDAIYRFNPLLTVREAHAGLYYRYIGGDPKDPKNHVVIHHTGIGGRVVSNETLYNFTDNGIKAYYGAYTASLNGKLNYEKRQQILRTGRELVDANIPYVADFSGDPKFFNILIPDWSDSLWDGKANDIERIRCDGVVEYGYEKNGIRVWGREPEKWDISQPITKAEYDGGIPFLPETQCSLWQHNDQNLPIEANELTPNMQRGVKGTLYTNMRPSQPENPTEVSNLDAITHDQNGYPIDPNFKKIIIEWEDATDEQSGIWGYYIKIDSNPISIPDHNDIAFRKVSADPTSDSIFPDRDGYEPRWESTELEAGVYYIHIRSIDNAGNWGDDTLDNPCTAHIGPLYIGPQATSYLIVHAHNPEGVEIASIQGMSPYSVEIYDGDTLIGYCAFNAETHNKPIAISAGTHTIEAKFNGMNKKQIVTLDPAETKTVTFMFERAEWSPADFLDGIGEVVFSRSYANGPGELHYGSPVYTWYDWYEHMFYIEAISKNLPTYLEEFSALHTVNCIVETTATTKMSINRSSVTVDVDAQNSMTPVYPPELGYQQRPPWYTFSIHWDAYVQGYFRDPAKYHTPVPQLNTAAFVNWYVQKYGETLPTSRRAFLILRIPSGMENDLVNSVTYGINSFSASVTPEAIIYTNEPHWFLDWDGTEKLIGTGLFYINGVKVASVPYDLTGTGVK